VPDDYRDSLLNELSTVRTRTEFLGEIHYTEIKGTKGKAFRVAQAWLSSYFQHALVHCPFKAFFVEQEGVRKFPYPGDSGYPEHAAQSLLSAFVAGIAWSYSKAPSIELRPIFDSTDNELDLRLARDMPDCLEAEVSTRRVTAGRPYPLMSVQTTRFVDSNPLASGPFWADSELIQLCDLLLGAALDAIDDSGRSPKTGRLKLARSVSEVLAETLQTPWFQQIPVHRRFSVSIYPDDFNMAYPAALRRANFERQQPQLPLL
jgi:hypothetical protein